MMDKQYIRDMAELLEAKLPDNHGFLLLTFEFNQPGRVQYVSNAVRADAVKTIKEFLFRIGEEEEWMKHIK